MKDPHILKTKKDWVHANSLNYDLDSNFIISFYNLGQIWKVDAHTGKVIWKVGKGGTIKLPDDCYFDQSHDAHLNDHGSLMFFDNGVDKRQSEVFALKLNEKEKRVMPASILNCRRKFLTKEWAALIWSMIFQFYVVAQNVT